MDVDMVAGSKKAFMRQVDEVVSLLRELEYEYDEENDLFTNDEHNISPTLVYSHPERAKELVLEGNSGFENTEGESSDPAGEKGPGTDRVQQEDSVDAGGEDTVEVDPG